MSVRTSQRLCAIAMDTARHDGSSARPASGHSAHWPAAVLLPGPLCGRTKAAAAATITLCFSLAASNKPQDLLCLNAQIAVSLSSNLPTGPRESFQAKNCTETRSVKRTKLVVEIELLSSCHRAVQLCQLWLALRSSTPSGAPVRAGPPTTCCR